MTDQIEKSRKIEIGTIVTLALAIVGFAYFLGQQNSSLTEFKAQVKDVQGQDWFKRVREAEQKTFEAELKRLTGENPPKSTVPIVNATLPVGTILIWGGAGQKVPEGWMLCDGSELAALEYTELYDIIGTTWGGTKHAFLLPNLVGRFLIGADSEKADQSEARKAGTYQPAMLPSHLHEKGNLRVAGGPQQGSGHFVVKTLNEAESLDATFDFVPDTNRNMSSPVSVKAIDILGVSGPPQPIPSATLDTQVRPSNAAVTYIIKVK